MTDFHVSHIQFPQVPSDKLLAEPHKEDGKSNITVLPSHGSSLHLVGFPVGQIISDSDGDLWLKEVLLLWDPKGSSTSLLVAVSIRMVPSAAYKHVNINSGFIFNC